MNNRINCGSVSSLFKIREMWIPTANYLNSNTIQNYFVQFFHVAIVDRKIVIQNVDFVTITSATESTQFIWASPTENVHFEFIFFPKYYSTELMNILCLKIATTNAQFNFLEWLSISSGSLSGVSSIKVWAPAVTDRTHQIHTHTNSGGESLLRNADNWANLCDTYKYA